MALARTSERAALFALDAKTYGRHPLHVNERAWPESNCYVDLCIEFLHAAQLEPIACLGSALASDFEGDQFTFVKPSFADIERLYGVEILELNIWRPLVEHALLQLQRGRLLLVEVDAFYLPDTAGTDYRCAHGKTTIGVERVDCSTKTLGYFHNAGYFELQGNDFEGLFAAAAPPHLPPYVEMVRFDRQKNLSPRELAGVAVDLAREHLRRRPGKNPLTAYKQKFEQDLAWLLTIDLPTYHLYAFSVLRQLGAAFELAACHLRWLGAHGHVGLDDASSAFDQISATAKTLILKLARAVNGKRHVDLTAMLHTMETSWERGMEVVVARLGT